MATDIRPTALFTRGMEWLDEAVKPFHAAYPAWTDAECRHYLCCDILDEIRHRQSLADLPADYKPLYYHPGPRRLELTPPERAELDTALAEWQSYVLELWSTIQANRS